VAAIKTITNDVIKADGSGNPSLKIVTDSPSSPAPGISTSTLAFVPDTV
jgi:hypothetical protein